MAVQEWSRVSRFCLEGTPKHQRFEAWRESIACIFDVERPWPRARDDDFDAMLECRTVGPLMMAHTRATALRWRRSAVTIACDGMDHYMIQFYARGAQRCDWRGGSVDMPAGGFLVYDLAREVSAETTDMANVSLVLPRSVLGPLLTAPDDHHMRAVDARQPLARLLADHMRALWVHAAGPRDDAQARVLVSDAPQILAACLNAQAPTPRQRAAVDGALLKELRRDIDTRLRRPELGEDDLVRRHNLSPDALARLFEPLGGIDGYIRERRLRAAMRALVDPAQGWRPVDVIGDQLGFADPMEFRLVFQRRFGLTPGAARRCGRPQAAGAASHGLDRRYEAWLHGLAAA